MGSTTKRALRCFFYLLPFVFAGMSCSLLSVGGYHRDHLFGPPFSTNTPPLPPHPPSSPSRIMELAFPATMFLSMSADESRQGAWASGARAALASDCNPLSHPSSHSWSRGQAGSGEFGGSFLAGVRSQRQRCDRRVYVRSLVLLCVVLGGVT